MTLPPLITHREFAALLKLSKKNGWQTIAEWNRKGKLKTMAVKVGNRWRYEGEKVAEWISRGGMKR